MRKHLIFTIVFATILMVGCSKQPVSPSQLAKLFVECKSSQLKQGTQPAICQQYNDQFNAITKLLMLRRNINLGQLIMDTQMKLVTTQQEFAKKDMTDQQRQVLQKQVADIKQQIVVMHTVFLLSELL